MRRLRRRLPDLTYAVTATTRPRRQGEVSDKSYYFLTEERYHDMLDRDELLAPAKVHGFWYGAPLEPIERALKRGEDVLFKIDVQGAIQVRRRIPQAVFVFLAPPSREDLIRRLTARHTESPEELKRRIHDANFEMEQMPHYDYVIVNKADDLGGAVGELACVITAERLRTLRQPIVLTSR